MNAIKIDQNFDKRQNFKIQRKKYAKKVIKVNH